MKISELVSEHKEEWNKDSFIEAIDEAIANLQNLRVLSEGGNTDLEFVCACTDTRDYKHIDNITAAGLNFVTCYIQELMRISDCKVDDHEY